MKCFVAIVISLVVLVQVAQSHTIPPTIVIAKSEADVVPPMSLDDNVVPEVTQPKSNPMNTCKALLAAIVLNCD